MLIKCVGQALRIVISGYPAKRNPIMYSGVECFFFFLCTYARAYSFTSDLGDRAGSFTRRVFLKLKVNPLDGQLISDKNLKKKIKSNNKTTFLTVRIRSGRFLNYHSYEYTEYYARTRIIAVSYCVLLCNIIHTCNNKISYKCANGRYLYAPTGT